MLFQAYINAIISDFNRINNCIAGTVIAFLSLAQTIPVTMPGADHFIQINCSATAKGVAQVRAGIIYSEEASRSVSEADSSAFYIEPF